MGSAKHNSPLRLERWAKAALGIHAFVLVGFYIHDYGGIFRMPFSLYLLSSCVFLFDVAVFTIYFFWRAVCRLKDRATAESCRPGDKGRRRVALALLLGTLLLVFQPARFLFHEEICEQPIFYYDRGLWTPYVQIHYSPLLKITSVKELAEYSEERYDCALPLLAKGLAQRERGTLPTIELGFEESWGGFDGLLVIREGSTVVVLQIPYLQQSDLPSVRAMTGLGQ